MKAFQSHGELLARIKEAWNAAEEDLKLAEKVNHKVVMPSINELRYAGRRVVEALHYLEGDEIDRAVPLLHDAYFDCLRARHDAIDAAVAKMALVTDVMVEHIGYRIVLTTFPEFPQLVENLNAINLRIAESRKDRAARENIYNTLSEVDFPETVRIFQKLKSSEKIIRQCAKEERRERLINRILALGGLVIGIGGIIPTDRSHDTLAHSRFAMDVIRVGAATRSFQASQQASTISS